MKVLSNNQITLHPLTVADAAAFYNLYQTLYPDGSPFLPGETSIAFTSRIINACHFIWTIRFTSDPEIIIGDCAFHHYDAVDRAIEIGGALLPPFHGKRMMYQAFGLILTYVQTELNLKHIIGKTTPQNIAAIKLVEKLGFTVKNITEEEICLQKTI
jgi:ribosomal-protein-alanine N-acetyltransferase